MGSRSATIASHRSLALAGSLAALFAAGPADALPAANYRIQSISQPGATGTSVRGVDARGRVLAHWSVFNNPPGPIPIGAEPDDEGYFLWQDGVATPLTIPGLTDVNIHRMDVGGTMWGSSDEGSFVFRDGVVSLVQSAATDVTIVTGVDAEGRVYGILGNYPPGTDPNAQIVPIEPVSNFVFENGSFSELSLFLPDATLHGVLQDGTLWGSDEEVSFLQDGSGLTIIEHPDFDYTGLRAVTSGGEAYGFASTNTNGSFSSTNFFWDAVAGFQELPSGYALPGTSLVPHAMNEAGVFWGIEGNNVAFVATPVPEPSTALLLALGFVMLRRGGRTHE